MREAPGPETGVLGPTPGSAPPARAAEPAPTSPPGGRERPPTGRALRLARWAIALLSLGLIARLIDWRGAAALLARLEPGPALAAWGLDLACILVSAWKWQRLLAALSVRVGLPALFRAYWIGAFASALLPSTVGGDLVRAALTRRRAGAGPVAASIIVERLTGLAVLLAIVLAVLPARPDLVAAGPLRIAVPLAVAAGAAVLLLPVVLLLLRRRWPPAAPAPGRLRALLAAVERALADYARRGGALLVACAVSLAFYALIALFQYAVVRALGLRVGLGDVAAVAPLVTLAAALPVSPNGLGVSEGVFVLLYARVGLSPEEALAAALLRRLILTLTAAAGGALWLLPERSRPATPSGRSTVSRGTRRNGPGPDGL